MIFLNEGDKTFVKGSGKLPYEIKKVGGVVSCSCPAWRNLGGSIDNRVCKHIKANIDPDCLLPQAKLSTKELEEFGAVVSPEDKPKLFLLAETWTDEDPIGWWISEKMDGVRAKWDGVDRLVSRLGNRYFAPESFIKRLPKGVALDGELWIDRGKFQQTVSVVRKHIPDESEWAQIKFVVFDAPEMTGPFEERQEFLKKLSDSSGSGWALLKQTKCANMIHMKKMLFEVLAKGGEGLMLRKPKSLYEIGRSDSLLKVKEFSDTEATVTGYKAGKGKYKNLTGSLECVLDNGVTFEVGSGLTDEMRKNPPAIGTKITFKFQGSFPTGKPRFPIFLSARDYE